MTTAADSMNRAGCVPVLTRVASDATLPAVTLCVRPPVLSHLAAVIVGVSFT